MRRRPALRVQAQRGVGEIKKKLTVQAHRFSKVAADKIAKAGGTAEILA